ncbi:MAG: hypothetical protein ABSG70_03860 [Terriglobales bacterium]
MIAETLSQAIALLRANCYTAALFDQYLLEAEPQEFETAVRHLDTAIPVEINLGTRNLTRLVLEVQSALRRRRQEEMAAREAAVRTVHGALNAGLTTLLLDCELALETAGLPPAARGRLTSALEAARKLRTELEAVGTAG